MSRFRIAKPYMDESIASNVLEVLHSGKLVQGALVARFEAELADSIPPSSVENVMTSNPLSRTKIPLLHVCGRKGD
jgi:dTDP-4-amino-4,6-dideoxygalactose transaminase